MPGLEPGQIVRMPFPNSDGQTEQHRPALVVATPAPHVLWVLMVTSAANRPWPGDVAIPEGPGTGLPAASVVPVAKIATMDAARAGARGRLAVETLAVVRSGLAERLGIG
jgi:mRNA interferase MazF